MRIAKALLMVAAACTFTCMTGCEKPQLYGEGRLHDMSQIKRHMSPNEVRRIMGSNYKEVWETGLQGIDQGKYAWDYPEGRIYFDTEGVFRIEPFDDKK